MPKKCGDSSYDLSDFANEIGKSVGTEISYVNLKEDDFKSALIEAGLPEGFAGALADAGTGISNGWLVDESKTLSKLIGRSTTSMQQSVSEAVQAL